MVIIRKRGLSPVIATVLLIALAMVLAMIVFMWARGWLFEQIEKKGEPIDSLCESVEMAIDYRVAGNVIHLTIVNRGSVQIYALDVKQEGKGSVTSNVFNATVSIGSTSGGIKIPVDITKVDKVTVYPMLLGNIKGKTETKAKTCLNSGYTINL